NIQKYVYIISNRQVVSILGFFWRLIFYRVIHLFSIFINITMMSVIILLYLHLLYILKYATTLFCVILFSILFSIKTHHIINHSFIPKINLMYFASEK